MVFTGHLGLYRMKDRQLLWSNKIDMDSKRKFNILNNDIDNVPLTQRLDYFHNKWEGNSDIYNRSEYDKYYGCEDTVAWTTYTLEITADNRLRAFMINDYDADEGSGYSDHDDKYINVFWTGCKPSQASLDKLVILDNGNVEMRSSKGKVMWQTETTEGGKPVLAQPNVNGPGDC